MIDQILKERAKTHGDYTLQSHISQTLKDVARTYSCGLSYQQKEALDMILHKISRILAGDPNEVDHWKDIAGYATLAMKEIEK